MTKRSKKRYGDWQILSGIAEGGQAWAHSVLHKDGREGILKVIKNPKREWRFDREVLALKSLKSTAVPKLLDYGESNGRPWLVTENCGRELVKVIKEASLLRRLLWFRDIVLATSDAHHADITHRDIKPNNVVISLDGASAYLIDFGICAISDANSSVTTVEALGNAAFAAPECSLGHPERPDKPCDIYSLGKVLYWLTSDGKSVFREDTEPLQGTLTPLSRGIETRILSIIRDCVKESSSERLTADELLSRSQNLLDYAAQISEDENRGIYRILDNFGNNGEFNASSSRGIISPGFTKEHLENAVVIGLHDNHAQAIMLENNTGVLILHRMSFGMSCLSSVGLIEISLVEDSEGTPSGQQLGVFTLKLTRSPAKIYSIDADIKILLGRFWILMKAFDLPKTYVSIHTATEEIGPWKSFSAESGNGGKTWEIRESKSGGLAVRLDAKTE